jgi:hypothetical protein
MSLLIIILRLSLLKCLFQARKMIGHVLLCCAIDCVCFYDFILELFDSVVLLFFHFIFPSYPTLCHQILQKENESTKVFTVQ